MSFYSQHNFTGNLRKFKKLPSTLQINILPSSLNSIYRAVLIAVAAVQAVALINNIRQPFLNAPLRAVPFAGSAAYTGFGYKISLFLNCNASKAILFPKYRIHSKIEVLNLRRINAEYYSYIPRIPRVNIGKVWLLLKNHVAPFFLLRILHRISSP